MKKNMVVLVSVLKSYHKRQIPQWKKSMDVTTQKLMNLKRNLGKPIKKNTGKIIMEPVFKL